MLFKLIKTFFSLSVIGIISYYLVSNDVDDEKNEWPKKIDNSAKLIEYRLNIKGGKLLIKAEKASMKNLGLIDLRNMSASFKKKSKNIDISARKCTFFAKDEKAILKEDVIIKSGDLIVETDSAVIDGKNQIIYGESEIFGSSQGSKFKASGFSVKEDGKISLKHARIIKNEKSKI